MQRVLDADLPEGASGGGSEANLSAAAGLPALDGLGGCGGGAHSRDEYVVLSSVLDRVALLAGIWSAPDLQLSDPPFRSRP